MSTLPASALPHLNQQLDGDHEGVDQDLCEIAKHMLDWEEELSIHLKLTAEDVRDINFVFPTRPQLQR